MRPLICLHGIGTHGGTFARQIEGLEPRRVIGLDLPGYGGTPLDGPMTFRLWPSTSRRRSMQRVARGAACTCSGTRWAAWWRSSWRRHGRRGSPR